MAEQSRLMAETTVDRTVQRRDNGRILFLLLVNISLATLWHIFLPAWGAPDYVIGLLVGALALTIYERAYGQRIFWLVLFILVVMREIIVSTGKLIWLIVQPQPRLDPGIVALPLRARTDLEIIALATVITLTPGTLSMDLDRNGDGQSTLYVHSVVVDNPDTMRRSIQSTLERRLLLVTRGQEA